MLVVLTTLWFCYILGFLSFVTCQPTKTNNNAKGDTNTNDHANIIQDDVTHIDPGLFAKALTHAKTMTLSQNDNDSLIAQLNSGNIQALYTVAQSLNRRNAGDDRITSVQLWHALADGPAHHVPSAVALGFSYSEVDKYLALKYFVQAAEGNIDIESNGKRGGNSDSEGGGPHQAALYNAGRLFLELNDPASSLAYIRACANLEKHFPHSPYVSPDLAETCKEAYGALSSQIVGETTSPPGIEDAAEMFLYSSIDEFPNPNGKEFGIWSRVMEYLDRYAEVVRGFGIDSRSSRGGDSGSAAMDEEGNGKTYLVLAQQELENLQSTASGKMSELQKYLVGIILGRVQLLLTAMEVGDIMDEL
mmetsp:Transcript_22334/g.46816  ORF Transcript_22334/g.46816 Transcript_22334/m.46816 type:complete len:361 (-) Transcript_22334:63-1145(-)